MGAFMRRSRGEARDECVEISLRRREARAEKPPPRHTRTSRWKTERGARTYYYYTIDMVNASSPRTRVTTTARTSLLAFRVCTSIGKHLREYCSRTSFSGDCGEFYSIGKFSCRGGLRGECASNTWTQCDYERVCVCGGTVVTDLFY
ncbi:unnamed protein product [Trichogramma brassicae]|uniref:Uncharacterized protein n=1 Tax=Trichogramma brassicae TaxID=86971 RepID=A0A6H5J642_9HYME|nr:unnamed protein product [Trichogramma brassicae]